MFSFRFLQQTDSGKMQMWNKGFIFQAKKNSIVWLHCCAFLLWSDSLDLFSKIIKNNGSKMQIEQLWRVSQWFFLLNHQIENVLWRKWLCDGWLTSRMKINVCVWSHFKPVGHNKVKVLLLILQYFYLFFLLCKCRDFSFIIFWTLMIFTCTPPSYLLLWSYSRPCNQ